MASLTYAHGSFTGVITAVWRDYPVSEPRPLPIDLEYLRTASLRVGLALVAHWRNRRNREIIGRSDAHSASEAQAEFEKALEAAYAEELALSRIFICTPFAGHDIKTLDARRG